MGGDEWVEIKGIGGLRNGKIRQKMLNGDAPERIFFLVICKTYMLRNGNSGLKMGVSRAAHTQYAYMGVSTPREWTSWPI